MTLENKKKQEKRRKESGNDLFLSKWGTRVTRFPNGLRIKGDLY
jgi:hypothetical protein